MWFSLIKSFGDGKTEKLFNDEFVKKFQRFEDRAKRKLESLKAASSLDDLKMPQSNRLEKLLGNLRDFYSIRINDQWRLVFRL